MRIWQKTAASCANLSARIAPFKHQLYWKNTTDHSRKQGAIKTLKIAITAEPMDSELKEAENFSFLGFHDNIVIYIEPASRLPIQADGVIPTIGKAQLQLNEVVWKPKSEWPGPVADQMPVPLQNRDCKHS